MNSSLPITALAGIVLTAGLLAKSHSQPVPQDSADLLYNRFCTACHGETGDGLGPASAMLWPMPRDFRSGNYKWRSTPSGMPPMDKDLLLSIRYGVPGTSMHDFSTLSNRQIQRIIDKLKTFAPRKFRRTPHLVTLPPAVDRNGDVARGQRLYAELGCVQCHGPDLAGDGPSAPGLKNDDGQSNPPYNLRKIPPRRPHAPQSDPIADIYLSLATGLSGTPMPAYQDAVPAADLWAVAAFVASKTPKRRTRPRNNPSEIPPQASARDRSQRIMRGGMAPNTPHSTSPFAGEIMPQGRPSPELAPAQASLSAKQCARCHNKQYREWQTSLHSAASSPGLEAQLLAMARNEKWATLQSCQRCHNPLAEQNPVLSAGQRGAAAGSGYQNNPAYQPALRHEGLNCASCHVRKWQRLGPPQTSGERLALPGYPIQELAIYERSDFCMPCHQLPSSAQIAGKPLLNTYKEWLEGPYMRRGVQCQHCHMPDREHTWRGVHDPATFAQGIAVQTLTGRGATGTVSVRVKVKNVGAGHYLPTTPTPAAWVSIQLVDREGKIIDGAYAQQRIGRHLVYEKGWKEREDTRIPPGESLELVGAWKAGRVGEATHARIEVRVEPDEYYERFYLSRLKNKSLPLIERNMFIEALQRTRESHYVAHSELMGI